MQEPTDVDVIVIGAGVSGIAAACKAKAGGKTVRRNRMANNVPLGHAFRGKKPHWWKSLDRCIQRVDKNPFPSNNVVILWI